MRAPGHEHGLATLSGIARLRADLKLGFAGKGDREQFARRLRGYGAYTLNLESTYKGSFSFFLTAGWVSLISRIFGLQLTCDICASLHFHPVNSPTGWVHTDYNAAWFGPIPSRSTVNIWSPDQCDYFTGRNPSNGQSAFRRARAVTLIYFLNNDAWSESGGGETALFYDRLDPVPAVKVPPVNNSLLAFECSPISFHTFMSNRIRTRSSFIMWFHTDYEAASARWGMPPTQVAC